MSKQSDSIKADILTRYMGAGGMASYMGDGYGVGIYTVKPSELDRWLEFEKLTVNIKMLERITVETGTGKISKKTSLCYNGQNMIGEWWPRDSKIPPSKGVTTLEEANRIIHWLVASGIMMSHSVERIIDPDCLNEVAAKGEDIQKFIEKAEFQSEIPRLTDLGWHLLDRDDLMAIVEYSDSVSQYSKRMDDLSGAARWFADRLLNQTHLLCLTLYHDLKDTARPVSVKYAYGRVIDDEQLVNFLKKRDGKEVDGESADQWLVAAAKNMGLEITAAVWPRTGSGLPETDMNPPGETTIDKAPGSIEDAKQMIRYLQAYRLDNKDKSAARAKDLPLNDLRHYELNNNNVTKALAYLQRQNHYNADEECAALWLLSRGKQLAGILTRMILLRNQYRADQPSDHSVIKQHLSCFYENQPQNAEAWLRNKLDKFNELFSESSESDLRTLKIWQHYDCSWDSEERRLKHEPPLYRREQGIILADGINNDMAELIASHFLPEPENINRLMKCFSVYNPAKSSYEYAESWLKRRRQVLKDALAAILTLEETHSENWRLVREVNDTLLKTDDSGNLQKGKAREGTLSKLLDKYIKEIKLITNRYLATSNKAGQKGKAREVTLSKWLHEYLKEIKLITDRYLAAGDKAGQKDKEALVKHISLYDPRVDHKTYAMLWILSLAQPLAPKGFGG